MTTWWNSRRTTLSAGAGLATVLAAAGLALLGPLPAFAADTSTPVAAPDAGARSSAGPDDDLDGPDGDAWYVRFQVCPATAATATTPAAAATPATAADPNSDVIAADPAFILLPMNPDRVSANYTPLKRRNLCYDMAEQQIVTMNRPATTPGTGTPAATTTTTAATTTATTTTRTTAPADGG